MYDQKGIKRSFCTVCCGEEQCEEFEKSDVTPFCGYCGCPPIKHKRADVSVDVPNLASETSASSSKEIEIPEVQVDEDLADVSPILNEKEKLNSLVPELPNFSKCVENALNNGSIHGQLWSNMIMQCAAYYSDSEAMKTKTAYEQVGRMLFDKYPCIEGPGSKPWSHFTKCLSQKIRTERLKIKNFKSSITKKGFSAIANGNSDGSGSSNRRQASDEKKRTFFRSEANVPSLLSEDDIIQAKRKIASEWEKENSERPIIKSLLRDTFNDRTAILKEGVSFEKFLQNYPCFKDANYVLYEFSMLLGRNKMMELSERMKEFFGKLRTVNTAGATEGDLMLSDWLWFEKKCGIFQTKCEKSAPIIQVILDQAEYHKRLQSSHDFPTGVLLVQGSEIKDCALAYGAHFIQCQQFSIISMLTILLALYYILELNYPKKYVQAMGALASEVLSHEYYKLGQRAIKMIRLLK